MIRKLRLFTCTLLSAALAAQAAAQTPATAKVRIEGGLQPDGFYVWQVINDGSTPVTRIEIPHYHADQFIPPDGWQPESTFLVNVGVPDKPGLCKATALSDAAAIQKGRKAEFRMRLSRQRANRGTGTVVVGLADGTTLKVDGVSLPVPPARYEGLLTVATFGLLILLFVVFRPRRKQPEATAAQPADAG